MALMMGRDSADVEEFEIGGKSARIKSSTEHNSRPLKKEEPERTFMNALINENLSAIEEPGSATGSE